MQTAMTFNSNVFSLHLQGLEFQAPPFCGHAARKRRPKREKRSETVRKTKGKRPRDSAQARLKAPVKTRRYEKNGNGAAQEQSPPASKNRAARKPPPADQEPQPQSPLPPPLSLFPRFASSALFAAYLTALTPSRPGAFGSSQASSMSS